MKNEYKKVLAIDPGPTQSAYVVWDGNTIVAKYIDHNEKLIKILSDYPHTYYPLAVEKIVSYGMSVGESVFSTVFWAGRFCQAWNGEHFLIPRLTVKQHLCHDSRAKDSNIRQALIDRFEPDLKPRCRPKEKLKGLKNDLWAAFALAVTFYDQNIREVKP